MKGLSFVILLVIVVISFSISAIYFSKIGMYSFSTVMRGNGKEGAFLDVVIVTLTVISSVGLYIALRKKKEIQ